jgi:catechol 2,3-dioxygenase-like lactoylglutathione lyase family enzyme
MKAHLYHLQLNVTNIPFYRDFFSFLEYKIIDQSPNHLGATDGKTDLWIIRTDKPYDAHPYHRKACGLNHMAFRVPTPHDVDRFNTEFLVPRNIIPLYGSPKSFPEYHPDYYAVYFEDPDRIKLEIVYRPAIHSSS